MASRGSSKAARLRAWLDEHRPQRIGPGELEQIQNALAPVSASWLRKLVRASGAPLDPLVEGVVQDNLEDLARTLTVLQAEYESADATQRQQVRRLVIEAKEHCGWALRRMRDAAEAADEKREAMLWMRTWLENPPVFDQWLAVRRRSQRTEAAGRER